MSEAASSACLVCGGRSARPVREFGGIRGQVCVLRATVCSDACEAEARRFAARRAAQRDPARAGLLVSLLGLVTAGFFALTGRELGRVLVILALFGLGTTRLAYPDALPGGVARQLGLRRARPLFAWVGVALCTSALVLAVLLAFG